MNPGRNDPCPCGSGKKYKKCCLLKKRDADSFILGLNNLYALVKTINTQLITKSNKSDYSIANFTDAMDLAITSNALSLIKAVIQDNYYSREYEIIRFKDFPIWDSPVVIIERSELPNLSNINRNE